MIPTRIFGIFVICAPWLWVVFMCLKGLFHIDLMVWGAFWYTFTWCVQMPAFIFFALHAMLMGGWVCRRPAAKLPYILALLNLCTSWIPAMIALL